MVQYDRDREEKLNHLRKVVVDAARQIIKHALPLTSAGCQSIPNEVITELRGAIANYDEYERQLWLRYPNDLLHKLQAIIKATEDTKQSSQKIQRPSVGSKVECTDPRRTIMLLDQLEALGFDDDAFARLHHFRQRRQETIKVHRQYCRKTRAFFADSNNARLQRRLELVLAWYKENGGRFIELAEAAVREIPFRPL